MLAAVLFALQSCGGGNSGDSMAFTSGSASLALTDAEAWTAVHRLLGDLGSHLATETDGGAFVTWHYSGGVSLVWGEDFSIPFKGIGCAFGDEVQRVQCFFERYADLFGMRPGTGDYEFLRASNLRSGGRLLRFRQALHGLPVFGADITVTLSPDRQAIAMVYSHFVRGLTGPKYDVPPDAPVPAQWKDRVSNLLGSQVTLSGLEFAGYWVDQNAHSTEAIPVRILSVETEDGRTFRVAVHAVDGQVLKSTSLNSLPPAVVDSHTAYRDVSTAACTSASDCYPYGMDTCYSDSEFGNHCTTACTSDSQCVAAFGTGWACLTAGDFNGQCNLSAESPVTTIYSNGFLKPGYQYERFFYWAQDVIVKWRSFLFDELGPAA